MKHQHKPETGCFNIVATLALFLGNIRVGRSLHLFLLKNILSSPMAFFDSTPTGRILNRFGKELDVIDMIIVQNIRGWLFCLLSCLEMVIVVASRLPLTLIAFVPLAVFYLIVQVRWPAAMQISTLNWASEQEIRQSSPQTILHLKSINLLKINFPVNRLKNDGNICLHIIYQLHRSIPYLTVLSWIVASEQYILDERPVFIPWITMTTAALSTFRGS
ncbi:MRP1-like protein [Mya arenaria]|uniref:MRP1-like protein n=1 Tax=Mya arenaria TaxID=6604 RepID=A0ABY7DG91_MYAAR|nr:MRP1-like protein [Mya arenaria]